MKLEKKPVLKKKMKSLEVVSKDNEKPSKEYAAKMFKLHRKLVQKNTCFSTNREKKPIRGISKFDVPSIQYGRSSEFMHLQKLENQKVDLAEKRTFKRRD